MQNLLFLVVISIFKFMFKRTQFAEIFSSKVGKK